MVKFSIYMNKCVFVIGFICGVCLVIVCNCLISSSFGAWGELGLVH